LTTELDKY